MEKINEQQAFEIELRKELDKFFPGEFVPDHFHFCAGRALQYQSLQSLRIGIETYQKLLLFIDGDIEQITYYEISFLINAISSTTPKQLTEDSIGIDYIAIQKDINNLSVKWNSLVDPIKESVRRKIHAFAIRGIPANGKIIH